MYDARLPVQYQVGAGATTTLSSTGYTTALYTVFLEPAEIRTLYCTITTTLNSTGNTVVDCYYRPTIGSTSGQVKIGTLTMVTTQAASTTVYQSVTPYIIPAGGTLIWNVSTAASSAGAGILSFRSQYSPEILANDAAFTKSS